MDTKNQTNPRDRQSKLKFKILEEEVTQPTIAKSNNYGYKIGTTNTNSNTQKRAPYQT